MPTSRVSGVVKDLRHLQLPEQGVIRFLQDVPLEEVSNTPLVCPRLFLRGPLRRVTNTYLRCKHEVQLVSGPDYEDSLASRLTCSTD